MKLVTKLRKLLAFILMTFVEDCPKCHKHFYGFNKHLTQVKLDRHYRIVCHRCAKQLGKYG